MIKEALITLILSGIPETFLCVLGIYLLSGMKIPKKTYYCSSILLALLIFFIRKLPINYGVHTILNIISLILLSIYIIKIPVIKAISYTFIVYVLLSLSEVINVVMLINMFNVDINSVLSDPISKSLFGLPYLFLFGSSILLIRIIKKNK
jgi:hypothetical protein